MIIITVVKYSRNIKILHDYTWPIAATTRNYSTVGTYNIVYAGTKPVYALVQKNKKIILRESPSVIPAM